MRSARKLFGLLLGGLFALAASQGCGGDDHHAGVAAPASGGGQGGEGNLVDAGSGGATDPGVDAQSGNDASTDGEIGDAGDGGPANCGALVCRGHGKCLEQDAGAQCICDEGYRLKAVGDEFECEVDTSCIRLKYLQRDGCRSEALGAPAVGLFFAVDYCAGTAVLPDVLGSDLSAAFKITEDDIDVKLNPESYATVIQRDVESYVTFVLDMSTSVTQDAALVSGIVAQLRSVVQTLVRPAGEPPTAISILAFGRFVAEILPFTTSLAAVDAVLANIESDPSSISAKVDGGGTSLYDAVKRGIEHTERIQALREVVTDSGVLTSGTLVVVTDGKASQGQVLPAAQIDATLVNLISVGISNQIEDVDLTAIGRDGSFLAPTQADWTAAFAEIAQRVSEYPKRAYLLGYCSPAVAGEHTVKITLASGVANGIQAREDASCGFNASRFGFASCDASFFTRCDECGGLTACGACPDNECCADGICQGPGSVASAGLSPGEECYNQDELCRKSDQVCMKDLGSSPVTYHCKDPVAIDQKCNNDLKCSPGASWCDRPTPTADGVCKAITLKEGQECLDKNTNVRDGMKCPDLNCAQRKEVGGFPFICLPEARAFDRCSGATASAVCESGTACQKDHCTTRHAIGCTTNLDCASGACEFGLCVSTGLCYFSWDEKLTR